jgi:exodeoxyribonuclease VII large subunit
MMGIDPRYTLGDIAQSRDEVVRRLVAEGLLDANKRHRLSPIPLRVGVVASVGTAAWHDFHDEIARSRIGFVLAVADTRVQGDLAENMVTAAIARLSMRTDLDAIVVIRGGGARNELAVFDSEKIARIIAAAPVPVLTGLGHEVDRSVADDVAHTALKTPTACAGELIGRSLQYAADTEQAWAAILQRSSVALSSATNDLSDTAHRIARRTHAAVERSDERLELRVERLVRDARAALVRAGERLDRSSARVSGRPVDLLHRAAQHLDVVAARIGAVDPAVQLARGWTITRRSDGSIVRRTTDVAADEPLTTTLIDGSITSVVRDIVTDPAPSASIRHELDASPHHPADAETKD